MGFFRCLVEFFVGPPCGPAGYHRLHQRGYRQEENDGYHHQNGDMDVSENREYPQICHLLGEVRMRGFRDISGINNFQTQIEQDRLGQEQCCGGESPTLRRD
jgi:hypothetical protein